MVEDESMKSLTTAYQDAMTRMVGSTINVTWRKKSGGKVDSSVILVPVAYNGHLFALHFISAKTQLEFPEKSHIPNPILVIPADSLGLTNARWGTTALAPGTSKRSRYLIYSPTAMVRASMDSRSYSYFRNLPPIALAVSAKTNPDIPATITSSQSPRSMRETSKRGATLGV